MELWKLTKSQYEAIYGKPRKNTTLTDVFSAHKSAIEIAINQGKILSNDVLSDYPEFSEQSRENFLGWLDAMARD